QIPNPDPQIPNPTAVYCLLEYKYRMLMKLDSLFLARRSPLALALGGLMAGSPLGNAPRDWSGKDPIRYPDPDIIALDKRFNKYKIGNTPIQRLYTGKLWSEGPAWNSAGGYLVWSDIPNDRQLCWLQDDGHVSTFRNPSGYSNGNTFDYEGRQLSC